MKLIAEDVMCTSIPEPKHWNMDGREGVSYKVDLSDGNSTIQLACKGVDVYGAFVPFERYSVIIDLEQTNFDGRKGVKAQVVRAEPME